MHLPEHFGPYRILRKLGAGGMGAVYLAQEIASRRLVALKIPTLQGSSPQIVQRFEREARAAARIQHPHVCRVYDVGVVGETHYLAMEYVDGQSLAQLLHTSGPLSLSRSATLVRKVALALHAAHCQDVLHRDVKPANILLRKDGEPVLTDFGLAHCLEDARLTVSGAYVGTPLYMSPEQAQGPGQKIGPGCDVYSLGVVLYELLTGRAPFQGNNLVQVIGQQLTTKPQPPSKLRPGLDPRVDAVCLKAMALDAGQRYADMEEFAAAMAPFTHESRLSPPAGRTWWPAFAFLALSLVALGLVAVGATQAPRSSEWLLAAGGVAAGALAVFLAALGRGARGGSLPAGSDQESHSNEGTDVPEGTPPEIVNSIGMRLRLIPAGKFTQGSPPREAGRADHEGPQREVTLTRAFYLGVHPVTQAEYLALCRVNPAHFQAGRGGGPEHPVETVSWDDAVEFCRRLSARPEEQSLGRVYRLPTEAEWEYACRAGTRTTFHGGDSLDSTQANFNGDFPGGQAPVGPNRECTSPVGAYPPNAWRLEDMHGNVWEWCLDRYAADAYRAGPAVDPTGPPRGEARVLRGGSWALPGRSCRAAARDKLAPGFRGKQVGFRVVCEVAPGAG